MKNTLLLMAIAVVSLLGCADSETGVDLFELAAAGDVQAIEAALADGANIDATDPSGATPLVVAALFGQTETVELLTQKGADLSAKNMDGATALHVAAFFCRLESARALIQAGADVNAENVRGETPLDTVSAEWSPMLGSIYGALAGAIQIELDMDEIQRVRLLMAELLREQMK